jgi:hypothetical protein
MVVPPVWDAVPLRVRVPDPACTKPPVPEIAPLNPTASDRLNAKVALFTTSPVIEPVVPPVPTWSVPEERVVPPV